MASSNSNQLNKFAALLTLIFPIAFGIKSTHVYAQDFSYLATADIFGVELELADTDNDGIANHLDNCVLLANSAQADQDLDGIGDICDKQKNGLAHTNYPTPVVTNVMIASGR